MLFRLLFAFPHPAALGCRNASPNPNTAKRWSYAKHAEPKPRALQEVFRSFRRRCLVPFAVRDRCTALRRFSSDLCRRFGKVRRCADMPAPERNHVQVVRCKCCKRCIPISVEAMIGSVTVLCPVCMERRSYIVSTEVFLGQPSWEVTRNLQGRR